MGKSVHGLAPGAEVIEPRDRRLGERFLLGVMNVALRPGERLVAEHSRDLVGRAAALGKPPPGGLPQPMRLAVHRPPGGGGASRIQLPELFGAANGGP